MNNAVIWDVAPCRSCVNRHFGGKHRLYLQDRKIRERGTSVSRWLQTEPPVENTQLYKNRKGGRVGHMKINNIVPCSRYLLGLQTTPLNCSHSFSAESTSRYYNNFITLDFDPLMSCVRAVF
jgi:hypothetical protein